jgi:hypothetical protein
MSETIHNTQFLLALYDPAFQAADGSYWTWHAPELNDRLLATTYYELLVPSIPPNPNQLAVDHLWAGMGDVSDEWRCFFRFISGGCDQRGRPGRYVVICAFVARADCRMWAPLDLLQGDEFQKLAQRAPGECPLAVGQLRFTVGPAPATADPVVLAEVISAGRFQCNDAGAVHRAADLLQSLPADRRWQATLRDVGGERCAEIRLREQRRDRPPPSDPPTTKISGNEQVRQIPSPISQVLGPLSLITLTAAVVAAAAYGLLFPLSLLEFCLAVGALGIVALIWLIKFARVFAFALVMLPVVLPFCGSPQSDFAAESN